jgi:hypothetical protein
MADRSYSTQGNPAGTAVHKAPLTVTRMQEIIRGSERAAPSDALRAYLSGIHMEDVETQRETKDKLPERLRKSHQAPQIVTVQPRGSNPGGEYVILPAERFIALAAAVVPEHQPFVPITARMRACAPADLDTPVRPQVPRRRRSVRAQLPEIG